MTSAPPTRLPYSPLTPLLTASIWTSVILRWTCAAFHVAPRRVSGSSPPQCLRQRLLSGQTILGVTAAFARRTATKFKLQTPLILCGLLAAWVSRHNAGANNVAALSGSQLWAEEWQGTRSYEFIRPALPSFSLPLLLSAWRGVPVSALINVQYEPLSYMY